MDVIEREVTEQEFQDSNRRMQRRRQGGYAVHAHLDREQMKVSVEFSNGVEIAFPVDQVLGLAGAHPDDLSEIEVSPAGLGLYWPRLDVDIYLPSLLEGVVGSREWMASRLGAVGGRARSKAKAASSRRNGLKGGRPRKAAEPKK